jgi:phage baseplate assembly protein W
VNAVAGVAFPVDFDGQGRTSLVSGSDRIRQMIEQVLFTQPGERVNLPEFGSGLLGLVFAPGGDTLAAATQQIVQAALQQWLGDLILLSDVEVEFGDGLLRVSVGWVERATGTARQDQFQVGVP